MSNNKWERNQSKDSDSEMTSDGINKDINNYMSKDL